MYIKTVKSLFPYILMIVCLIVFWQINKREQTHGNIRQSLKKQNIRKGDIYIIFLLGGIMICSLLLFQTASIDLFSLMGIHGTSPDVNVGNIGQYFTMVIMMAVFPAIVEEFVFRGVVLQGLRKNGAVVAVLVSSLLFSLYHMNAAQTAYQFIMGLVYASVIIITGSLLLTMLLHFINNFIIITYTFIVTHQGAKLAWGTDPNFWNGYTIVTALVLAYVGLLMVYGLVKLLKRKGEKSGIESWQRSNKKFSKSDYYGYIGCIAAAVGLWITAIFI